MRIFFFSDLSCTHGRTCVCGRYAPDIYGEGEDPIRRNNFPFLFMQKFRSGWFASGEDKKKKKCPPLAVERPAAAMFVLFRSYYQDLPSEGS